MAQRSAELLHVWGLLGELERRVVMLIARRILMGQNEYGKLRGPDADTRDMVREEGEEVADALVYSATREVYRRLLEKETGK